MFRGDVAAFSAISGRASQQGNERDRPALSPEGNVPSEAKAELFAAQPIDRNTTFACRY
jgi:hypothetical protein